MSDLHRPGQAPWQGQQHSGPASAPNWYGPGQPAPATRATSPALRWALQGAVLVAVAAVSGAIWWFATGGGSAGSAQSPSSQSPQPGRYQFTAAPALPQPRHDPTCPEHAYGKIQEFLKTTLCKGLTRGLYTVALPDGRSVYASVSAVAMADDASAAALRELADKDGTGNIKDLVREGITKVAGLSSLSANNGYTAVQRGSVVIIVEADFAENSATYKNNKQAEDLLDSICEDAVRLGQQIAG